MKGGGVWILGLVAVVVVLFLVKRQQGVTTVGDSSASANALQAARLQAAGPAFAALSSAYGSAAQAQANIQVAKAQADAQTAFANAQVQIQNSKSSSMDLGNIVTGIVTLGGLL